MTEPVGDFDAVRLRADNPGLLTLDGTNTWVLDRDPCWVVDPGPDDPAHLDAIVVEAATRGGVGGVALTHGHPDHADGVPGLLERLPDGVVVGALGWPDRSQTLVEDGAFGPLRVLALPGHADDHVVFLWDGLCCSGDAVLGAGSVFVAGDMAGYLAGLERLRARRPRVVCPGHGPLVTDPAAKLAEYVEHRLAREAALRRALEEGARGDDALLDAAWADTPAALRPAAALTMHAHLRKLEAEGRLPADVTAPPPPPELPHV